MARSRVQSFYFRAVSATKPSDLLARGVPWIKVPIFPPDFITIEILNGNPTPLQCSASRGLFKFAGDRVCWVNKDTREHIVQFLNGQWPFLAAQNPGGDEKITVPALGASSWYSMVRIKGVLGISITYDYYIDTPPTPPGPSVIGDD